MPVNKKTLRKAYYISVVAARRDRMLNAFISKGDKEIVAISIFFLLSTLFLVVAENKTNAILATSILFFLFIALYSYVAIERTRTIKKLHKPIPEYHPLNLIELALNRNYRSFEEEVNNWIPENEYRYSPNIGIRFFAKSPKALRRAYKKKKHDANRIRFFASAIMLICLSSIFLDPFAPWALFFPVFSILVFYVTLLEEKLAFLRIEMDILRRNSGIAAALKKKKSFYKIFSIENISSGGLMRTLDRLAGRDITNNPDREQ